MPQRLFSTGKIGLFLDTYQPGSEKRRDETAKVIKATFRLQPFDAKLATSVDDGLSDNSGVQAALFTLSSTEPKPHIERLNFNLSCPRQNMVVFAAPDTAESRIALLQVKITGPYARVQKDLDGYAFVFVGTFGPVDRATLEYVHAWHGTQRFVTFEESEPNLEFEDTDDEGADENTPAPRPKPMWDESDDVLKTGRETTHGAKGPSVADTKREKGHRYPKKKTASKKIAGKKRR